MTDGIVLVHGAMHTSACWSRLLPLLELPAVAVDLPGRYGRPGDLATIGLDDCVAAVIQDADHASLGTFALVGHSLGGVTVTETAYRHPHRVSHLVYVGAVVLPLGSTAARLMTGGDWEGEMEPGNDEFARSLFGNDLTDEQWAEHAAGLVPEAPGLMNATLSGHPTGIPITYVRMSQDVPMPPATADRMVANLGPGVETRTIDAGHSVMMSQPEALAAIVNEVVG